MYPQNSVKAFEEAAKAGFYAFECDVHTTSDGEWIVIHDDTVDKMTNGSGNVEDFTFEEIRKLRLDGGNGIENYPDLQIPTLEETLAVCDKYDIVPIIELKKLDEKYLPDFVKALKEHKLLDKAIVISFNFDYLKALREIDSSIEMMYLVKKFDKATVDMCAENGNIGIDFKCQDYIFSISAFNYAKEKGLKLGAWTVDNTIYSDVMRAAGVDLITTNRIIPV
ncbi:MAG: glycerophosphodiester phosphodiesterase [Acutalibacteraceae bacterium]